MVLSSKYGLERAAGAGAGCFFSFPSITLSKWGHSMAHSQGAAATVKSNCAVVAQWVVPYLSSPGARNPCALPLKPTMTKAMIPLFPPSPLACSQQTGSWMSSLVLSEPC